jgi:hypothetical protein
VLASAGRLAVERARRGVRRGLVTALRRAGLPSPRPRVRAYQAEHAQWSRHPFRERIERAILRPDSLSAEIFGRERLEAAVRAFFDRGIGPVQFVGALYVFEASHRDLAAHLRAAARAAETTAPRALAST